MVTHDLFTNESDYIEFIANSILDLNLIQNYSRYCNQTLKQQIHLNPKNNSILTI